MLRFGTFYASSSGTAHDANDRIVYDTDTGILSYDADGIGEIEAIEFARLAPGVTLSERDFFII